jgi:hypothetical protein
MFDQPFPGNIHKFMRSYSCFLIILALFLFSGCAAHEKPYSPDFSFSHTKAEQCEEYWLTMERLIKNRGVRCRELLQIDGFPYLRGTRPLLQDGLQLTDRKAVARWLEMMRTADMQARYRELDALPDTSWAVLCSEAGISNCEAGRLRAHTARCSALLLGDERINPDFMDKLREAVKGALERDYPAGPACFQDGVTLDGILPENISKALIESGPTYRGGAVLEQRVNRVKSMSSGSRGVR